MKNLYSLLSGLTFFLLVSFNSLFAQAPVVDDVNSYTTEGTKIVGQTVVVTVTFSEPVTVTGTPTITLETGSSDKVVDFTGFNSGSSGAQLNFTYTVEEGHTTAGARLDYVSTTALSGTIKSAEAPFEDATLTLATPGNPNSLSDNKNFVSQDVPNLIISSGDISSADHTELTSISMEITSNETITKEEDPNEVVVSPTFKYVVLQRNSAPQTYQANLYSQQVSLTEIVEIECFVNNSNVLLSLSLIHISEPTRPY